MHISNSAYDYSLPGGSDGGLPHNIIAWLRVVSDCCKIRYEAFKYTEFFFSKYLSLHTHTSSTTNDHLTDVAVSVSPLTLAVSIDPSTLYPRGGLTGNIPDYLPTLFFPKTYIYYYPYFCIPLLPIFFLIILVLLLWVPSCTHLTDMKLFSCYSSQEAWWSLSFNKEGKFLGSNRIRTQFLQKLIQYASI